MHRRLVLYRVWLPRAIRLLLPTLAGETVLLLKSTALASTIAVVDLLGAANVVRAQTFQVYQPLLLVAAIYVCLTFIIEGCFNLLERTAPVRRESAAPRSRAGWVFWRRKAKV